MIAFLQFLILKKDICLQYKYKYPFKYIPYINVSIK